MSPNRRIILNTIATYGRSMYSIALGLFSSRWVLAALGKVDFGLYGVVGGLAIFVSFINQLLSQSTARFYAYSVGKGRANPNNSCEECREWFNTAVLIHTVVPCFLVAVGLPLGEYAVKHWLTIPADRITACLWVFRYACLACFISMVNVPFQAMYTAKQEIAELTVYGFVQTTASACFVYFMFTHPGDWLSKYALWVCVASSVPQLIICARAFKKYPECKLIYKFMWSRDRIRRLASFACWQAFGGLGVILRGQGIQILINKYFGPTINGSMSIANHVAGYSQTLSSAMQGAFAPAITAECGANRMEAMREMSYRVCKFGLLLSFIFVIPLSVELKEVMRLWLGDPPVYAVELCWCVLGMHIIDKSAIGHMLAVSAYGKISKYQVFLGSVLMMTLPLAWLLVFAGLGVCAVGWAMIATIAVCVVGRVMFARSLVGMSGRYWVARVVLPAAIVGGVSFLMGLMPRLLMEAGILRVVFTTLVCLATLMPLSWFFMLDATEREFLRVRLAARFNR